MNKPTSATEALPTHDAQRHLADSRAQIAQWLKHDGAAPAAATSLMNCAVRGALPLLSTLAQAWLHSVQTRATRDSAMRPIDVVALSLTRRHPTLILATAATAAGLGLLWWWRRSSTRSPSR